MASRRLESAVPIWLKVVTICVAEVSRKNLLESLAQFLSSVEVALIAARHETDILGARAGKGSSHAGQTIKLPV